MLTLLTILTIQLAMDCTLLQPAQTGHCLSQCAQLALTSLKYACAVSTQEQPAVSMLPILAVHPTGNETQHVAPPPPPTPPHHTRRLQLALAYTTPVQPALRAIRGLSMNHLMWTAACTNDLDEG